MSTTIAVTDRPVRAPGPVGSAFRVECRKLASQHAPRLLALICLIAPFAFTAVLKAQSGTPSDSVYGVWVHSSGFAVSLVTLGFAGMWGLPLMAGVLAGDMFASEDRHGTWKTLLTRSCTRGHVFVGKVLAVSVFAVGLLVVLAVASVAAGVLLIGAQPLVSLSGAMMSPGRTVLLVAVGWLLCVPPLLAFVSIAVLLSVSTRNGIVGVLGPPVIGGAMQLLALVGTGVWVRSLLVASAFDAWHVLFVTPWHPRSLIVAEAVGALWISVCLGVAWWLLRRRDITGATRSARPDWIVPVRVSVISAAGIALLAIAGNWGPAGVTTPRLESSITSTFNNLTLLQQREVGHAVPAGARLHVLPSCSRRSSTPVGPGDWTCTLTVVVPQPGPTPFALTPVTYDVSVDPNGCYKAESPPTFVGQQTMADEHGRQVVNPLFLFYGCVTGL